MSTVWHCLDKVRGLVGVPALWRSWLGGEFATFERAFLEKKSRPASSYPCSHECGCEHDLVERADGSFVAVCTCDPWNCDDFAVTRAEAALLELNWSRLGLAICKAFDCEARNAALNQPMTRQVGSFGAVALPIVLTIQDEPDEFRGVAAELAVRLPAGFVLLTPTRRFFDATCQELLAKGPWGFYDLESNLALRSNGTLQALKSGSEMFGPIAARGLNSSGAVQALEGIHREIAAFRDDRAQLRVENKRLKEMQSEGLFKFTHKLDARTFKIFCAILAEGNVAEASRTLAMKDSTLRDIVRGWPERGKSYAILADLVRWRKKVGRSEKVPLNDSILLEKGSSVDYPGLLSDVLDGLLSMTDENWEQETQALAEVLRPYVER